ARFLAIESHMPDVDQSMHFIYAQLMSDQQCMACGATDVADARARLAEAIAQHRCVVCGSALASPSNVIDLTEERLHELQRRVERSRAQLEAAEVDRDKAHAEYMRDSKQLAEKAIELEDARQQV